MTALLTLLLDWYSAKRAARTRRILRAWSPPCS